MQDMEIDSGDDSDEDVPIFTPELARLKAKEQGLEVSDDQMEDDQDPDAEVDSDGSGEKVNYPDDFSDSSEEKEDYTIRKTDCIIVAATAENDHSNLEVYIYEHEHSNIYVHHEIILGSYPLCIEWLPSW